MRWSFKVATIAGTEVRIHVTFFILLAFVALHGFSSGQGAAGALDAVLFISAMFLCVLLHEFGHVFAARGYGIRTPDITLLPIGGVARLERMPRTPAHELVVAVCGPLVNVGIAALIFLGLGLRPDLDPAGFRFEEPGRFWEKLLLWNRHERLQRSIHTHLVQPVEQMWNAVRRPARLIPKFSCRMDDSHHADCASPNFARTVSISQRGQSRPIKPGNLSQSALNCSMR